MRPPKGFGKNYFTLAAIQATVAQNILHSQYISMQPALHVSFDMEDEVEDELLDELVLSPFSLKASHCSCYCSKHSHLVIKDKSLQNCKIAQFLRTDSVSSPPKISPIQPKKISIYQGIT
jgi:hypothetical protein